MEQLATYLRLVVAPNPGPMTLEGTNTWVIGDPDQGAPVVVDPGPSHAGHLDAVWQACVGRIAAIVLTHRHLDHAAGAAELARVAGCGVRAADPGLQVGAAGLFEGDELDVAGARLRCYATPGHTSDSCSFLLTGEDSVVRLLSGDTVLGRGTTVIAAPDGHLASYLRSLDLLQAVVQAERVVEILPGHGPRVTEAASWLSFYRRHRLERLEQVRTAVAAGAETPTEIVARVYADVDRAVWPAAEQSVAAQLEFLAETSRS